MESEGEAGEVIAIFHEVLTDLTGSKTPGSFIIGKSGKQLLFCWRQYQFPSNNRIPQVTQTPSEITLHATNIQRIMVNYYCYEDSDPKQVQKATDSYILISTINPSNMHQFIFPKSISFQLITFLQILAINKSTSSEKLTLSNYTNYINETYAHNKYNYRLYDIPVELGILGLPNIFSLHEPQSEVVVVQPDLHIISQFDVKSDTYMKNPIIKEELTSFETLLELKKIVLNRGITPELRGYVWPVLFNILPFEENKRQEVLKIRTKEYLNTKYQWSSMSRTQLKNVKTLRDSFATIRVDVKRTHPEGGLEEMEGWAEILVSILRTYSLWNQNVKYTQGLNDLVVNFMAIFFPLTGAYSADEAEALTFWCFAEFVESTASGLIADNLMQMQERELNHIMSIVDQFHPGCANWLRANGFGDLSFLIAAFMLAYGRSFCQDSIARIWEALVCAEYPSLFLRYFSATLLILSFPSFLMISDCSAGKLLSSMDPIFYQQDVGALIGVSLSMMNNSLSSNKTDVSSTKSRFEPIPIEKLSYHTLFEPDYSHYHIYQEDGNLFV